ncbi:MAG: DEAD/DEAH box helicase family protein [Spirochaetes bacterium]|nr:DEAD/DEAH box helicase family protein [Spirochaetota bacterium]MBN2770830.1 DEAD/DEAH box helicase family protein [Spirochaetota bacterium]
MELKPYQQKVLSDLQEYFDYLQKYKKIDEAFDWFWADKIGPYDIVAGKGMEPYKNNVPRVPNVCIKVPTAGGKTFIACNALKTIFDSCDIKKERVVVWLVPSVTILEQTIRNLSNVNHPYRQKINTHFSGRVEIYTKETLLQGASFNPTAVSEQLSIIILSFDTLRSRKKEDRKIYQDNGQLASFTQLNVDNSHVLEGTDETALINVIRKLNPILIVDESHNAETDLSIDMLTNLNPSFILDLTATPRNNSNIISFASAIELKKENMVKLPVIVYNRHDKTDVINSALQTQKKLEFLAKKEEKITGKYIRPIVLFQAQPKTKDDNTTFEKLKEKLIALKIPEEQIKIKTANVNELKGLDLMSKKCPVRYIITVNALKEGWDCSFAYILASLADRSSAVDVEQILGRILRQPHVVKHTNPLLNASYVLTASSKFMDTLSNIVEGLNKAGFSEKDYKVSEDNVKQFKEDAVDEALTTAAGIKEDVKENDFSDVDESRIDFTLEYDEENEPEELKEITKIAVEQSEELEAQIEELECEENERVVYAETSGFKDIIRTRAAKDIFKKDADKITLPKFYLKTPELPVFDLPAEQLVNKEILLKDFTLSKCDTEIDFDDISSDLYKVDIIDKGDNDYSPLFMKIDRKAGSQILDVILTAPQEKRVREVTNRIMNILGDMWPIPDQEIAKYIKHVINDFSTEQITDYLNREYTYTYKIKQKIRKLSEDHAEKYFQQLLDSDQIVMNNVYRIPTVQIQGNTQNYGIVKSLYEEEYKMNEFEKRVINDIANLENILFWTRNPERKGFNLNGFINHYPDFIVVTKNKKILIVETKGDDRDNSDSETKLKLGNSWANKAGEQYKYFMVFDKNAISGAHNLTDFMKIVESL